MTSMGGMIGAVSTDVPVMMGFPTLAVPDTSGVGFGAAIMYKIDNG